MIPLRPDLTLNTEQMEREYEWRISNGTAYGQTLLEWALDELDRHAD